MSPRPRRGLAAVRHRCPQLRSATATASVAALAVLLASAAARGQETSDKLRISADDASNWVEGDRKVLLVERNVTIRTDDATLTADRAVVWLSNRPESGNYTVEIALAGNARVVRGDLTRTGGELFVTASVRPDVQLDVLALNAADRSTDVQYLAAAQLRRQAARGALPADLTPSTPVAPPPAIAQATTAPTTGPVARRPRATTPTPVTFQSAKAEMSMTPEGRVALVLSGGVFLVQTRENGDRVELQADDAVLYTQFTDVKQLLSGNRLQSVETDRDLDSVYLEGDVRMGITPGDPKRSEQSLRASRLIYEFGTDRAILTDALLHARDPAAEAPIVVRARAMRKLGTDVYEANDASISTSSFATPSIALGASKVTVRQQSTADVNTGTRTAFVAENVVTRLYGVPVFYLPRVWGSSSGGAGALRDIALSNSNGFGFGVETQWGLFETLGREPPENVDASYALDYYSDRGPAGGIDANYSGGSVNENTLQPWGFNGNFTTYAVLDDGVDRLGKRRLRVEQDNALRGRLRWDHQQFLNDGWQVQARASYVSDGTFLEEWFRNEFRNGLPQETSLYLKRSVGSEVFSVLGSIDLSNVPTAADQLQEVYVDNGEGNGVRRPVIVERLPEIRYDRLGDSLLDDRLTLMSNNGVGLFHFSESRASLDEIGFRDPGTGANDETADVGFAGIPTHGYTGYTDDYVLRGDARQELSMPMGDDRVRVTPYGVVRYTAYSDSPGGGVEDRVLAGAGVRTSTQFHRVYDGVSSKLLDVNRLRHVVEPQANVFASAATIDRDELYQYDEGVDGVSDLAAAQLVVRQRFQTKRGGEGRWRSVDFLTLNTGAVLFANEPDEVEVPDGSPELDDAGAFRGVYLSSMPEASVARSNLFADAAWRVTDTTALLSDVAWNLEHQTLATAALGLAVQRDPRVRYFAGARYIGEINSTIGTIAFDYVISERYQLALNQTFDFGAGTNQDTSLLLTRKFEQFIFTVSVFFDQLEEEGGIAFSVSPRGLPFGFKVSDGNGARR